ncbi:6-phosphogluconate dehydrogenase c-terminal domain-like protein [Diplodia corticola]|uniref:6-phosphogluconate dehydrogenase c-terminal domain-like protein n=1 Tax=Diplodia corticola TaxID=236234 RepID=A0A1J9S5P1_9PEZI|nr:6-phosphogluconate dehydrogenase c-terminal domain-like protein [Diplodia corticola]OJD35260.1 6-phosphogluconate dehydrogenase c-terminal domain-like protein [Diplodia corticola]
MGSIAPRAAVGIISIGDMGLGIAKLLQAYNYEVLTTTVGRSPSTHARATSAGITVLPSDGALVEKADYILSIVPPRDAVATANRIIDAWTAASSSRSTPLYFLDLNAIAPSTARSIDAALTSRAPGIRFIDGGIIGSPPKLLDEEAAAAAPNSNTDADADLTASLLRWKRPSIPISGPHALDAANTTTTAPPPSGAHLAAILNTKHLDPTIGPASGLKACFAAMTKGFYALALQSFTTAHGLGLLPELRAQLAASFPALAAAADRGAVGMQHKAYRWEGEMREVAETLRAEGGWGAAGQDAVFDGVAEVYRVVAEETGLGTEEGRKGEVEGVVGELAVAAAARRRDGGGKGE